MITLRCTQDVVMLVSKDVRFKAGESYEFYMSASGEISRMTEHGLHIFKHNVWPTYFKFELESV